MTKEELEKEAKKFLGGWLIDPEIVKLLVDFAEPREKKIESLGRRCLQLQKDKGELTDKVRELEKENTELKKQVEQKQHLADVRLEQSLENYKLFSDERKARIDVDIALEDMTDNLTKAKDHIKKLLDCLKQDTNDPQTNYYVCQYMDKAEQFLKEEQNVFNQ